MESRELIKEIPSGRFHSAIFTTFSINLYYWEEQFIRALSSKGINNVSALVDSNSLSEQLLRFSYSYKGTKPFDYCLHGVKSQGAFHPKIHFFAGSQCVLVLIGSGNLTVTGHGRNLEVWAPIMIDNMASPLYPLVRDVWNYIKGIYNTLGKEAHYIIESIETNCDLLKNSYTDLPKEHIVGNESVRFFSNWHTSIFSQCVDWIGDENIKAITVLSPFYDSKAELIKALYSQFRPKNISIIYEKGFGVFPKKKSIPNNCSVYNWEQVVKNSNLSCQRFYHAKCFFFEGETNNYVLFGSANASVAAFGLPNVKAINQEACIGFKSSDNNYFEQTGFILKEKGEIEEENSVYNTETLLNDAVEIIWIKEVYCYYLSYNIAIECKEDVKGAILRFYSGRREIVHSQEIDINKGSILIKGNKIDNRVPLYLEIVNTDGAVISNRQFVISAERVESNNPSPESIYYRKRFLEIEAGKFVNSELLRFFDQVINDTEKKLYARNDSNVVEERTNDEAHLFSSLEEYLADDGTGITGDKAFRRIEKAKLQSTLFFDSIISYILHSFQEMEEKMIGSEELDDVTNSEGCEKKKPNIECLKTRSIESIKTQIHKMLGKYIERIEGIALNDKRSVRNVILLDALKQFMAAIYFLYRIFSFRYVEDDDDEKQHPLIDIQKSKALHNTATEYFYRIVGLFSLYLQKSNYVTEENIIMKQKIDSYIQYTFELCIAVFSVCDWVNLGNTEYITWSKIYKEATLLNLKKALNFKVRNNEVGTVLKRIDRSIQEMDNYDSTLMEQYIRSNLAILESNNILYPNGQICYTDLFGYVYLLPKKEDVLAYPCSIACKYDRIKKNNIPDYLYLYKTGQLLQPTSKAKGKRN